MSPRKRSTRNAGLPDGLRVRDGYYSYKSPLDGRERGIGRDRLKAIQFAREANAEIRRLSGEQSAAEWVRGESAKTWGTWLDKYKELLGKRSIARRTRVFYELLMRRARAQWPESIAITAIDTAMIADAVDAIEAEGKHRMAQAYRQWLQDCFRCSIAKGWRLDNPVSVTDRVKNKTKRARLTLDMVLAICKAPTTRPWLRNAIMLALVTGQRREDIVGAKRKDVREGCLWVEQRKTGAKVAIPLALRLDALGCSLGEVIDQCRATNILSHYIVHQTTQRGGSRLGAPIYVGAVTKQFTAAMRLLSIDWSDRTPATFHELRSLSKRLYDAQGGVNTQQLLGHSSPDTAAIYSDGRGEWVRVAFK
jgi:integrase